MEKTKETGQNDSPNVDDTVQGSVSEAAKKE